MGPAGAAERFKVESASLAADGTVRLYIRNLGGAPVDVGTIYVYPAGSLNPICVGHGVNAAIPPGTVAAVETTLTCTHTPTPGGNYVVKVVTTRGAEYAYTVTATLAHGGVGVGAGTGSGGTGTGTSGVGVGGGTATGTGTGTNGGGTSGGTGGGGGGGGVVCSFVASSGKWFGSPDGSPARGFNELNGWVAAWGPSGGGIRIALMPGITPPDSTGTRANYTVELNNVQIGTLTVSNGTASVSITGTMPDFMEVARIWLEPGGHVLYDNGPRPAVVLAPGTYQVKATLRAKPRPDIYGRAADLTLTCNGTPAATITVRVPNPEEWGIRADIYTVTLPLWPPFQGANYTYKGTWSVGAIYFYMFSRLYFITFEIPSPYISLGPEYYGAPKWVAYWVNSTATRWRTWAIKFTGRIYVPWSNIRVGAWHIEGAYVKLCSIDTGDSWWPFEVGYQTANGTCSGAPGEYSIEVGYYVLYNDPALIFIIGPDGSNEAYFPTIDGAWRCANFNWDFGTCSGGWSFVPASPSVPHFRRDELHAKYDETAAGRRNRKS
jgi:hypothetical protein